MRVAVLGVADDANQSVLPQVAPSLPQRTDGIRVKGVGDLMIRAGGARGATLRHSTTRAWLAPA